MEYQSKPQGASSLSPSPQWANAISPKMILLKALEMHFCILWRLKMRRGGNWEPRDSDQGPPIGKPQQPRCFPNAAILLWLR
ncbi:hypothetical protein PAAG_11956 [Paracoccidioides lutzii Pb01]|uniref:Uncharacterized protein n=1 Tax=Paracoccidioides lutzii (strain ATCC MYA-826 / Pb01) TaxID=502779 RepID=A0A0A2V5E5_PARBA|nr:hypothetical protein PAAG_11956 [Paracoccidioides lutzii Pb01]KGQ01375.1 hypothetical protein PAAG_11956 [Paracoccidioides lutzii Pb01]